MAAINKDKGFALITSLLFSSILLIITVVYVARVTTEYRLMTKVYNSTAALDLAEAGIDRALWEISYNNSTFSGWNKSVDGNGNQIFTTSVNAFKTKADTTIGDYDISASIAPDGMSASATATGYVPNRVSVDEKKVIKVTYARHNFSKAILAGHGNITMSGQAYTDSYDSSLGPYSAQPHTKEGDIASNYSINLSGQAHINGDANPGPGYPFSGTPPVSGSYGTLQAPISVDPIPASAISAAQASNSDSNITITHNGKTSSYTGGSSISVSGQDMMTLPGGVYYFTSISTSGQATINVTGASTIYVDGGTISISGQGIVNNGNPSNLLIYSTGPTISLSGQAAFTGAIYAPTSSVTLSGQENLYGSLICGSDVDSGQAAVHFDLNLLKVSPVFASNRVSSYQEIK